jgi:hypothetical protein
MLLQVARIVSSLSSRPMRGPNIGVTNGLCHQADVDGTGSNFSRWQQLILPGRSLGASIKHGHRIFRINSKYSLHIVPHRVGWARFRKDFADLI